MDPLTLVKAALRFGSTEGALDTAGVFIPIKPEERNEFLIKAITAMVKLERMRKQGILLEATLGGEKVTCTETASGKVIDLYEYLGLP